MSFNEGLKIGHPRNYFERGVESAMLEVSRAVCQCIETIEKAYLKYSVYLILQKEYLYKLIMSIVAPVELKVQYDLSKEHYISASFYTDAQKPSGVVGLKKSSARPNDPHKLDYEAVIADDASQLDYPKIQEPQPENDNSSIRTQRATKKKLLQKQLTEDQPKYGKTGGRIATEPAADPAAMTQQNKCDFITQWIQDQAAKGIKITQKCLLEQVMNLNPEIGAVTAKKWVAVYFKKYPEANEIVLYSGTNNSVIARNAKLKQRDRKPQNLSKKDQQNDRRNTRKQEIQIESSED